MLEAKRLPAAVALVLLALTWACSEKGEPGGTSPDRATGATSSSRPDGDAPGPEGGPETSAGSPSSISPSPVPPSSTRTDSGAADACPTPQSPLPLDVEREGKDLWVVAYSGGETTPLLLRSSDDGVSWDSVCLPGTSGTLRAVEFLDARRGWAVGFREDARPLILRTEDGGLNWSPGKTPDSSVTLLDVSFADERRGLAVGLRPGSGPGGGAVVLRTVDGGATWAPASLPAGIGARLDAVSFPDASHAWAVGQAPDQEEILLASDDGGVTWRAQELAAKARLIPRDVGFAGPDTGWVVGDRLGQGADPIPTGVVMFTSDGGEQWSEVSVLPASSLWGISFLDADRAFAVGGGTRGQVVAKARGEARWSIRAEVPSPALQAVSFADEQSGAAVSQQRPCVYLTRDGGRTWRDRRLDGGDVGACRS